jgi:hypothetical protein
MMETSTATFTPIPVIKSTYDSTTKQLTSKFLVPEAQQQYKFFDLELVSNGVQHFITPTLESYVLTSAPLTVKVENPKVVVPKNKYAESEDIISL